MPIGTDFPISYIQPVQNLSAASNAADAVFVGCTFRAPSRITIEAVYWTPTTSQAGSATNFSIVKAVNLGTDGAGTTVVATYSLSATGEGIAALQVGTFTNSSTVASLQMTAGQVIGIKHFSQGNGIACVAGKFEVKYRHR